MLIHGENDLAEFVSSKTPLGLVIFNYELLIKNLHEAKTAIENGVQLSGELDKAMELLALLAGSLDLRYEISSELMSLYMYANRRIISAKLHSDAEQICEACDILSSLLDSWRRIEKEERAQLPAAENAERIVTGFEYKGGKICEISLSTEKRGISV